MVAALLIIPIYFLVKQFGMGTVASSVITIFIGGLVYVIALRMMNNIVIKSLTEMIVAKLKVR